jgi:hypothetical protein
VACTRSRTTYESRYVRDRASTTRPTWPSSVFLHSIRLLSVGTKDTEGGANCFTWSNYLHVVNRSGWQASQENAGNHSKLRVWSALPLVAQHAICCDQLECIFAEFRTKAWGIRISYGYYLHRYCRRFARCEGEQGAILRGLQGS